MSFDYKETIDVKKGTAPRGMQEWQWRAAQEEKQFRTYAELVEVYNLARKNLGENGELTDDELKQIDDKINALVDQGDINYKVEFDPNTNEFIVFDERLKTSDQEDSRISLETPQSMELFARYIYKTGTKQDKMDRFDEQQTKYIKAYNKSKKSTGAPT